MVLDASVHRMHNPLPNINKPAAPEAVDLLPGGMPVLLASQSRQPTTSWALG